MNRRREEKVNSAQASGKMKYLLILSCIFTLWTGLDAVQSYLAGIQCEPGVDITFLDHQMRSYLMTFEFDQSAQHLWVNELSVDPKTYLKRSIWNESFNWYSMTSTGDRIFAITYLDENSKDKNEALYHLRLVNRRDGFSRSTDLRIEKRETTVHIVTLIDYFTCERSYFSYYWEQKENGDDTNVYLYDYQRLKSWRVGSFQDWQGRPHMRPRYMIAMVSLPLRDQLGMVIYDDEQWKYGSLDDALRLKTLPTMRAPIPFRVAERDFK